MRIQGVVFDVDDTLYDMAQPFYAALRRLYGERSEFDLPSLFLSFRRYSDERFGAILYLSHPKNVGRS